MNALVRVNYAQTIFFYNNTYSPINATDARNVSWIKADIGIDWQNAQVYGKIQGNYFSTDFHADDAIDGVNGLMLYNLRPATTAYYSNIIVSDTLPSDPSVLFSSLLPLLLTSFLVSFLT